MYKRAPADKNVFQAGQCVRAIHDSISLTCLAGKIHLQEYATIVQIYDLSCISEWNLQHLSKEKERHTREQIGLPR